MADPAQQSRVLDAIEALRRGDRDGAVGLLEKELRDGPPAGERWRSISRLAAQIGEIDIAIESARRYSRTSPPSLERLLQYWSELGQYGRTAEARDELSRLSENVRRQPNVLHLLGTLAGQHGQFAQAERFYREALAQTPLLPQTWFALAMIKTFAPGDPDIAAMESLRPAMERAEPSIRARFLYGLAKAWHDCREYDRAFALYSEGARLRQREEPWDPAAIARLAEGLIRDFTPERMQRLAPSGDRRRALFVNGLPRSGSTLVEQVLASHSSIADGGEVNLLRAALIPTGDYSFDGAVRYEQRMTGQADPWGAIASTYFRLLKARFRTPGDVVDKTLGHSHFMGLLMHTLPGARVIWMRRDPEDTALSCFRTYFTSGVPWSWSLEDIGVFFRLEDRLHAHWSALFPDRILTVDYQQLVTDPASWIPRIAQHCGLEVEPAMFEPHRTKREVTTASVQQVRAPITTTRIGLSAGYAAHMEPFRRAYRG
ncbi:MAG: sulfotransferase [Altererythrobacter sp.]|nr:sulfotransferase [Altererythrobacter sp.]